MQQRKRREKTDGLGYYTYWDKNRDCGCVYCGDVATTREHVPSKTFLIEPYPDNLPTIPACFSCNNGFSFDEQYVAYYLEILKSYIFIGYKSDEKVLTALEKVPVLKHLIASQIKEINGKIHFNFDRGRFIKVINKLAIGHAGYDFDNVDFDGPVNTWFEFAPFLNDALLQQFLQPQIMDKIPEISSRFSCNYCVLENVETGESFLLNDWIVVQEQRYKYHIYINETGGITVKMVILDILYCQVDFN